MRLFSKIAVVVFVLIFSIAASGEHTEASNNLMTPSALPNFQQNELAASTWGGQHVSLEITSDGGKIEFDCAHGSIEGKVKLNQQGRFSVKGIYAEEHGGPTRQSGKENSYSVVYSGQIKGEKMKLTIKRSDTKKLVGTYTLTRGQEAFIVKCR